MNSGRTPSHGRDPADVERLREALEKSDFTVDGVSAALGPLAGAALGREQIVPALRVTTGGTTLETLIRIFLLGATEPTARVQAALAPLAMGSPLWSLIVEPSGDGVRAAIEIRPYGDEAHSWWVVSDLGTDVRDSPLPADHVLGIGGASVTLAEWTVRPAVASALDIGTGCGVQALHLSQHSTAVTATDRNPRALLLAGLTAHLNALDWELLEGDLLEPVAGRRFDLIVSNPPFVVGPAGRNYLYRDSGLAGDAVSRDLVRSAPALLHGDGWCQLLANWVHVQGCDWRERVGGWLAPGVDAWVVQREVQDPAEYVELWLRDSGEASGPAYQQRYDQWLDWFAAHRIEAVGFGVVNLHRTGRANPTVVIEELTQPIAPPIGWQVTEWFSRSDRLRFAQQGGRALVDARLVRARNVRLEQVAAAGVAGWTVTEQRLRLVSGLGSSIDIDPIGAALVAGANGDATLRQQLDVLAAAYEVDADDLTRSAVPAITALVQAGFLDLS